MVLSVEVSIKFGGSMPLPSRVMSSAKVAVLLAIIGVLLKMTCPKTCQPPG